MALTIRLLMALWDFTLKLLTDYTKSKFSRVLSSATRTLPTNSTTTSAPSDSHNSHSHNPPAQGPLNTASTSSEKRQKNKKKHRYEKWHGSVRQDFGPKPNRTQTSIIPTVSDSDPHRRHRGSSELLIHSGSWSGSGSASGTTGLRRRRKLPKNRKKSDDLCKSALITIYAPDNTCSYIL